MAAKAGVFQALCSIFAVIVVPSVVAVPVNTAQARQNPRPKRGYLQELKLLTKRALRNGKIRRVVQRVNTSSPPLQTREYPVDTDFCNVETWRDFDHVLCREKWNEFEEVERSFRKSIRTKQDGERIVYVHDDLRLWLRVFNKIRGLFVKNGAFQNKKENGQPFKIQTLKYVWRILCKFPVEIRETDEVQIETALLANIESALSFIDNTILPSLRKQRRLACGTQRNEARAVTREELTHLWTENQKRAIRVIRNDSLVEARALCPIDPDTLTAFYNEKSEKILQYPLAERPWPEDLDTTVPDSEVNLGPFTGEEVTKIVKELKTNTSSGYDGVEYGFLKRNLRRLIKALTEIFNICWKNRKIPADWKHATITLLPKRGDNSTDPGDWRPISLLTSFYKIYMKLIQSRLSPWIESTNRLSSRQKGSVPRNGLQEHVFCLKTTIDNFKHTSAKLFTTFVDIKDAYGSVDHRIMLEAMERSGYPQQIIDITKDIYTDSTFQVQTRGALTPKITRARGIIQGCPWSAIAFIQALDPWIRWLDQPSVPNSLLVPCQAYMDDICMSAGEEESIKEMMTKTEMFLDYCGMQVKHPKCAVMHAQRTGNNWARRDSTRNVSLHIQGGAMPQYGRSKEYRYLGFQVNLDGSAAKQQLEEIKEEMKTTLEKIERSPLPVNKKIEAINIMASTKMNFFYENIQFTEKLLQEIEDMIVGFVRDQLKLNTSSTRAQIFTPRKQGGLGVLRPCTMYHAKRVSFLLSVLNSDDAHVRATARESFSLHLQKRKIPLADDENNNFGGYKTNDAYRLEKKSKVNWPRSAFIELNELCIRLKMKLEFDLQSNMYDIALTASEDEEVHFRCTCPKRLYSVLKRREVDKTLEHWHGLQQQGRLQRETLPYADMANSISHLTNCNITDNITRFVAKGRLQLLETNAVNNVYYPESYPRECQLCGFRTDTNSHALNGCRRLKGMYSERHDRCVEIVRRELETNIITDYCEVFQNQTITLDGHCVDRCKPDLCFIDHSRSVAFVIEISNPFDPFIEKCYQHKFDKYRPLCAHLSEAGFQTKVVVLVIGSLGTVHRRFISGLKMMGLNARVSRSLARYLSLSVMIGSRRVWARRGCLLAREPN